jgi:hypothetical protein
LENSNLIKKLKTREVSVTLDNILDNSRANSGGQRDMNFLNYLVESGLLKLTEAVLVRTNTDFAEEYYLERYKKINYETDRHFLCRTIIQDELLKMGIPSISDISVGNMDILRSNSNYDIVTDDFGAIIDIGLTPARNYFRGLTDLKVRNYLITTYFDDYIDEIIFGVFTRSNDKTILMLSGTMKKVIKCLYPIPKYPWRKESIMISPIWKNNLLK